RIRTEAGASKASATATTTPSLTSTSARRVPVGSMTVPPWRRTSAAKIASRAQDEEQDGHAYRDAVGDLAGDDGARQIGDFSGDLHAAVHGPGVHDERVVAEEPGPVPRQPVEVRVLTQRRQQGFG